MMKTIEAEGLFQRRRPGDADSDDGAASCS